MKMCCFLPAISALMTYHCTIASCSNNAYRLNKWRKELCSVSATLHGQDECNFGSPFRVSGVRYFHFDKYNYVIKFCFVTFVFESLTRTSVFHISFLKRNGGYNKILSIIDVTLARRAQPNTT